MLVSHDVKVRNFRAPTLAEESDANSRYVGPIHVVYICHATALYGELIEVTEVLWMSISWTDGGVYFIAGSGG